MAPVFECFVYFTAIKRNYTTPKDDNWYIFIVIGYIDFPDDSYIVHNLFI